MDRGLAVIVTAVAGGFIALQPPLNAVLGRATEGLAAAFISFVVGTLVLAVILALSGGASSLGGAAEVRWYYLVGGGLLGAMYVYVSLVTVSSIGAGGVVAATITGQLAVSIALDRLGLLGLHEAAITPAKVLGVLLLLAGTYLVVR
jgi:bacterial/archaeal transporter family-2 protein